MSAREQAVNRELRALDDAHRLGRITREQYRARRRHVLASLQRDSNIVTARHTLSAHDQTTERNTASAGAPAWPLPGRPVLAWKPIAGLVASVLLIVVLVYLFVRLL